MRVDFHAHILPRADHGSNSVRSSLKQLHAAVDSNVDTIIATPHFYMDHNSVSSFLSRREKSYKSLMDAVSQDKRLKHLKIIKAAEVNLQVGLDEMEGLEKLCIEGTNYILIEMPMQTTWSRWTYDSIYKIESKRGLRPIIAHVDRYDKKHLQELKELRVPMQVNADGITSLFSRRTMLKAVKEEHICFLGSDVHDNLRQYKLFDKAVRIIGKDMRLFERCEEKVLNNQSVF